MGKIVIEDSEVILNGTILYFKLYTKVIIVEKLAIFQGIAHKNQDASQLTTKNLTQGHLEAEVEVEAQVAVEAQVSLVKAHTPQEVKAVGS